MIEMSVARVGLYYPYVHFSNKTWLKAAALYWPKMARIVPEGYPVNDDSITQALIDELDFVIDLSPDSAKAAASNMVSEALNAAPVRFGYQYKVPSDVLRKEHPRPYRLIFDNWADELYLKELFDSPRPWLPQWDSPWLTAAAHNSRVSRPIREALVRENWAIRDGAWLAMHPKVFWVYMC